MRLSRESSDDRGESMTWMLVMLTSMVLLVGVVFDGANLFYDKREAENVSSAAARIGAAQVSKQSLYRGDYPTIDTDLARTAAEDYANREGFPEVTIAFLNDDRVIEVRVGRDHPFSWPVIWGDPVKVESIARATAADSAAGS